VRRTVTVAAMVALLLALAGAAAAEKMYARASAPVRAGSGLDSATLGTLAQGERVFVTGRAGGYYQVDYRGQTGYVYANRLGKQKPEDVAALFSGDLGGQGIELTELEAGGALRGLSPMAESYASAADVPAWAVQAVEEMQDRGISPADLERFQKEGGLGEYAGGPAP
jgi:hypothetical protein